MLPDGFVGLYARRPELPSGWLLVHVLPSDVNAGSEPRWHRSNLNLFFFLKGRRVMGCMIDPATTKVTFDVVREFTEYVDYDPVGRNGVQGLGEGDIKGNLWALAGMLPTGQREVFLFDVETGQHGGVLLLEPDAASPLTFMHSGRAHGLDNIYATPSGNCLIGWYAKGKDRFQGVELYDRNMNFVRQLATVMGHMDVGTYQGRDVVVWCSSADPDLWGDGSNVNKNAVVLIDQAPMNRKILLELDWKLAFHVSCSDGPEALISAFAPANTLPAELIRAPFEGAGETLCPTGTVYRDYQSAPKASLMPDGSIVFCLDYVNALHAAAAYLSDPPTASPFPGFVAVERPIRDGEEYIWHYRGVNGQTVATLYRKA